MGIKYKIIASVGTAIFISFLITSLVIGYKSSDTAKSHVCQIAEEAAYKNGLMIEAELERSMEKARMLKITFVEMIKANLTERSLLDNILITAVKEDSNIFGAWMLWEPNAFDQKDAEFVNTAGHDNTGRVNSYWHWEGNEIVVEPNVDWETSDWYQLPKQLRKEVLMNPYVYKVSGKDMLLVSTIVPIMYEGRFSGVVGIDYNLDILQEKISQIRIFEKGYASLVANNATYVAHIEDKYVGKDIGEKPEAKEAIEKGETYKTIVRSDPLDTDVYRIYAPITVGKSEMSWSFVVSIPMYKISESSHNILWFTVITSSISLILIMIILMFLLHRTITKPLNNVITGLNEGTVQIVYSSDQISSASQSLAQGSSEQAASSEETSSSLEEMSSMIRKNADSAKEADKLMKEVKEVIEKANTSMNNLISSIEEIIRASEETSRIVKTIDEIAFQTNLLALNAAVEAARAGDAGGGFAVVAEEVRNLAMRAAEAARNTSGLIEGTVKKIQSGGEIASVTHKAFGEVTNHSDKVGELITEIAATSDEQAIRIESVSSAVTDMNRITQNNAASAEESASASEEMNSQAEKIRTLVNELMALAGIKNIEGIEPIRQYPQEDFKPLTPTRREMHYDSDEMPQKIRSRKPEKLSNEVHPEQIIPLDEDDFADF